MSNQPEYLTCTCNHCGQKLEFAAKGVGQEIQCPTCGKMTRLHRPVSVPALPVIGLSTSLANLTCPCNHCGRAFEFTAEAVGSEVECPTCGKPTRLSRSALSAIVPQDSGEPSTGNTPKVHCRCPHCKEDFSFELGLLGEVVHCPACQWQGVPRRDDVELSDFQALGIDVETIIRRLRHEPTGTAQPKPSIPAPPPIRPARAGVSAGQPTTQTHSSTPTKQATPSAAAVAGEKGKSRVRSTVAAVVLLAIGLPCIYAWHKQAQATEQQKQKTEQLKTELRLLEAQIQTGLSYNDFLAQVARVRAAYLAARDTLNESQEAQYEKLDSCLEACSSFFEKKQSLVDRYPEQEFFENDDFIEPFATRFGLSKRMGKRMLDTFEGGPKSLGYSFYESFKRLLGDTADDIEAFLKDQPCPWPK